MPDPEVVETLRAPQAPQPPQTLQAPSGKVETDADPEAAFILQQIDELDPGTSLTITEGYCTDYADDRFQQTDQCRVVMIDTCNAEGTECRKDAEFRMQSGRVVALTGEANAIALDGREVLAAGAGCWKDTDEEREFCLTLSPTDPGTTQADVLPDGDN